MNKPIWKSKKFWTTLATVLTVIASHRYGADSDVVMLIALIGSTLTASFGLADFGKEANGK